MATGGMNEYVQLDGSSVGKASCQWRRLWVVCLGVMSVGVMVVLCATMGQGMHLAVQEPAITMAGQYLQPATARQFPHLPRASPAGFIATASKFNNNKLARPWQSMQPAIVWPSLQSPWAPQKRDVGLNAKPEMGVPEAIQAIKAGATAKFDETIDVALNLNVDSRKTDQRVRGVIQLPAGTGKTVRVAVFAVPGPQADEAKAAGADIVGDEDLSAQVSSGEINFDKCIATPDMMPKLAKLARFLGPKGLMPNPKLGTVTTDVGEAVKAAKGGQVEFRSDKTGQVHAGIGKASFSDEDIEKNLRTFVSAVLALKPAAVKGDFVNRVSLVSTMGSAVRIPFSDVKT
jgi:large subunit ribosomal protein L1